MEEKFTNKLGNTNRDVIYAFKGLTDKMQLSDDNGWSNRFIYHYLLRYRNKLIREKRKELGRISQYTYQTISCIPLDKVDLAECPCVPASGCTFKKTKYVVPKPIGEFKSVTSVNGQITYSFVEWERLKSKINSRLRGQKNKGYYTVKNTGEGTYLYLYNDIHKKFITTTAIHENPIEVQTYPDCKGDVDECKDYLDLEFILDPDLLSIIYDMAIDQLLRAKQQVTDVLNDDSDNIVTNQKNVK